jgi:tRNA A-37 threonylcarbamoyl transferase component Bud32
VEGRTLEEIDSPQRQKVASDVRLVVERLHSHGLVHGALHPRNMIIDDRGRVHLTHLSPLLHSDFEKDAAVLDALFESASPLTPTVAGRERGPEALSTRAVVGAAVALLVGLLIVISALWWS